MRRTTSRQAAFMAILSVVTAGLLSSCCTAPRPRAYFDHANPTNTLLAFLYAVDSRKYYFLADLLFVPDGSPVSEEELNQEVVEIKGAIGGPDHPRLEEIRKNTTIEGNRAHTRLPGSGKNTVEIHYIAVERLRGWPVWLIDWEKTRGRDASAEDEKEVEQTLHAIFEAAEKKDLDRLEGYHLFGPGFTKFSERGTRQDAALARSSERKGIGGLEAFHPEVEDLKVDVFGRVAIATFLLRYEAVASQLTQKGKLRATIVFVRVGPEWRITHEHFSEFQPIPDGAQDS
jgi:hypothetical protein